MNNPGCPSFLSFSVVILQRSISVEKLAGDICGVALRCGENMPRRQTIEKGSRGSFLCLGIETSCDETAAAIVLDGQHILSNVVASQVPLHARFGGVVPEIASRAHAEAIIPTIKKALADAAVEMREIHAVAVVNRPGLIGSLLTGLTAAKTIAWLLDIPLIPVNHIEAHIYANNLQSVDVGSRKSSETVSPVQKVKYPAVSLVVSGGHTSIYLSRSEVEHELLGSTLDDAAGEAFDKVASILGLGYPGGPAIEQAAREGNPNAVRFERTFLKVENFDFSFSGIKTAVLYKVKGQDAKNDRGILLKKEVVADIAASFQEAVVDILVGKTLQAARVKGVRCILVGGGVACNKHLRSKMEHACGNEGISLHFPPPELCTDNAAMVAGLGYHLFARGYTGNLRVDVSAEA